ncbi:MAG: sensor histidine kinase [Actinomycetota bacterium]|nr:sensor histidine kinase [Actinomycetota bacterium]
MAGATLWERARRVNPLVWDGLLAIVLLGGHLAGLVLFFPRGPVAPDPLTGPALIAVGSVALAFRRRAPVLVSAIVAGAAAAYSLADGVGDLSALLIVASYSVAAHRDRKPMMAIALPVCAVAAVVMQAFDGGVNNWVDALTAIVFSVGAPMLLGRIVFNRRRTLAEDRERAARDAVAAERTRIARELHDVVAHAISVMVVQAGAARTALERSPADAERAIRQIEETGRDGLGEMRRLIGILRPDGPAALAPQPDLGRLDELLETMRHAGLQVEVVVEGIRRALPSGVELTAYRLVQEGLTNVLKHTGGANARVLLRYADDAIDVEVTDDGPGPLPDGATSSGHGLIGMRERVELFGGTLQTGARREGGFVVHATIPSPRGH